MMTELTNLCEFRKIIEDLLYWDLPSLAGKSDLQEQSESRVISRAQYDAARGINRNNLS